MEQFDAAIIGFGTAGLALGGALADDGQNIVVVEQSDTMYARWPIARTSTSSTAAHRSRTPRT